MAGEPVPDVFTAPAAELSEPVVRTFVSEAIAARLQAESLVLEFKRQNNEKNVVLAVAAMSNTDGGLVIVGVDEKALSDPFVGIRPSDVDSIVQQLRALVPGSMAEVIPVALGDKPERVLLILRVDADRVDRPVVVDGRVMKRVPGHSVGARRDEILAFTTAQRNQLGSVGTVPLDPGRMRTWADNASAQELRVVAQHLLPRHVGSLRYLGSPAMEAAQEALERGPVPRLIGAQHLRVHELGEAYWMRDESTALSARFSCGARRQQVRGVPRFEGLALVRLNGRLLDTLVAVRPLPNADDAHRLSIDELADMTLAASVAAVSSGLAIASSIGAGHPVGPPSLEGWINGPVGAEALQLGRRWEASRPDLHEYRLLRSRPHDASVASLHAAVVEWLTSLMLDLGAIDIENDLAALELPKWARQ